MGADLFIYSSSVKALKRYGPKFKEFIRKRDTATNGRKEYYQGKVVEYFDKMSAEGYYGDPCNPTNLLWKWVWTTGAGSPATWMKTGCFTQIKLS